MSCERGLSIFDTRHRFVSSILYGLPAGKGHKFRAKYSRRELPGVDQSGLVASRLAGHDGGAPPARALHAYKPSGRKSLTTSHRLP